jgi:hypothetical protein
MPYWTHTATEVLTGIKGGGALEKYIGVKALEPFINRDLVLERLVPFRLLEVEGLEKAVKGLPADLMIDSVMQLVQIEERESAARIAGDLAQTEARKEVVRALTRIQEDHEEFRRWKMPAAVQPP